MTDQKEFVALPRNPYVALARATIDLYVRERKVIDVPEDLPDELVNRRAGTFVTLHKGGDLRGCIGTITPTRTTLADEIIGNAILAATEDPRFYPVRKEELSELDISVDVLGEAEEVDSFDDLDPVRYGVIVTRGYRRGLLLPNLDGILRRTPLSLQEAAGDLPDTVHFFFVVDRQREEVNPLTCFGRSGDRRQDGCLAVADEHRAIRKLSEFTRLEAERRSI
jgi:AmmeMemoRadiSam system protein A